VCPGLEINDFVPRGGKIFTSLKLKSFKLKIIYAFLSKVYSIPELSADSSRSKIINDCQNRYYGYRYYSKNCTDYMTKFRFIEYGYDSYQCNPMVLNVSCYEPRAGYTLFKKNI